MRKITQLSSLKIRWLNFAFVLLFLCVPFLQAKAQTYCTPAYGTGCSSGDNLNSVVITGHGTSVISDLNTGCNAGSYLDNTATFTPVDLMQSQSYSVQLNTTYGSPTYELASIWIDFNDDGTFDDTTEKLLTDLPLAQSPAFVTASIAIPVTAPVGVHRMRVRVIYSTTGVNACNSATWGEAHDYKVNILALPACSGTPTAGTASASARACNSQPFTLTAANATIAGNMTYQWQSSPQGAGTFTNIAGANTLSYTVTNQTAATDYRFVVTCNTGGASATSNVVSVAQVAAATALFEGFETTPAGSSSNQNVPSCWTMLNTTGYQYNYMYVSTSYAKTGNRSYYMTRYPLTTAAGDMLLISPETDNLGNGTKQVRFSVRNPTSSYTPKLVVYRMNGTTSTATKTKLIEIPVAYSTSFTEYIVPLPATTDDYFAFSLEHTSPGEYPYFYIDDIYYEDVSPCIFPMNLQANNITLTGSTISWNASLAPGVTGYDYEVRTSGAAGSTGAGLVTSGTTTATSVNINSLTAGTTYYVYVRSVCGTSKGIWTMYPVKFMTLCPVFTANFFEGFENYPQGGSSKNHVPNCWTYINTTKNQYTYNYITGTAKTGSNSYYSYRYPLNQTDGLLMLVSPETDNLGNGTKQIRFWARSGSTSVTPKLVIYTMDGNTDKALKTLVQSIPLTSTTYTEYIVPLPVTSDDYFAFSFEHTDPTQYPYLYLDDIYYEDMSPCIFPINLQVSNVTGTTATVSWNASLASGVTGYEYEIRTTGKGGSGATGLVKTGTVTGTSVNVTGLNGGTVYYVYVRSICGNSGGMWTMHPVMFNTDCVVVTTTLFEGFESTATGSSTNNTVPVCWTYLKTGTSTSVYGYTSTTAPKTGSKHFYTYRPGKSGTSFDGELLLISPETDNLGKGMKRVRFSARNWFSGNYSTNLYIYTMDGKTAGSKKTLIKTINVPSTSYTEFIVYFPPNTTDDYFAFGFDQEGLSKYIFIDDINYEDAPNCKPVEANTFVISAIDKNQFTLKWTDLFNLSPVAYDIEVRATGNPGTAGAAFTATTAVGATSIVVTGLNPATSYKVYIRSRCSSTDQSAWSEGVDVTTLCNYPDFTTYTKSATYCGPQKANLTANLTDPAAVASWYDNENDPLPIFEGSNFISANPITQSRSFWLRSKLATPDTPVQVGRGTSTGTTSGTFLTHSWGGYKHQYIFTAAELKSEGLVAGAITALKFEVSSVGTAARKDFTISLGKTTQSAATTTHIDNSTLTQVYSNASETFAVGVKTFTFTTPYVWDGVSNIVVQTNWSNQNTGGTSGALKYHSTAPVSMTTYTYADSRTAAEILTTNTGGVNSGGNNSGGTSTISDRPNTVFVGVKGCISPAIEIPVTIDPKPIFELSADKATSCEGGVSDVVTIASNQGGYDTFVWTPSTGVSGNAATGWTFSTANEQEYTLVASQSTGICEVEKKVLVFAGTKPVANPTLATTQDVCKDVVTKLDLLKTLPAQATIGAAKTTTAATLGMSAFVQSSVYSKQQFIYSAAELTAQGVTGAGYITSLSFETIDAGASLSNPSYTIRMMLSPNTSYANTTFYTGNFATVYTKVNHTHTFQGVQSFTFDNPFYWDGQSNIVLEVLQEGAGNGNNAKTYYSGVTGTNVGLYAGSDTNANLLTGTLTNNRLNTKFGFQQAEVTWSPAKNLFLDAAAKVPYTSGVNASTVYAVSSTGGSQVYTATLTGVNGCATTKAYTINTVDVGTLSVQDQVFCKAVPVTNVVVSGATTGAALSFYSSATSTTPITTISQNGTYYVEAKLGNCKSARIPFNASIVALALPTAQLTQVICGSGTIADLSASGGTGAQIKWYSSATSATPLASTQALVNNTTYYAAQASNGCESGRIAVLVSINQAPAALTPQTISICGAINYGSVNLNQVAGSELVWYQSATSQQPIPNTSQVVSGTYYVSQRVNGCESPRIQIIASAQGSIPAPTAGVQNMCGGGTIAQLVAQTLPNATAEWFSTSTSTVPLAASTPLINGTYYLAQRIGNCMSVKVAVTVRVINTTAPVVSPFTLCQGATVADLNIPAGTGITHKWYASATAATALPLTDVLQTGSYFVEREQYGCTSGRTQVQVTISTRPNAPTGISPQSFDNYAEISNIVMNQPNVVWYLTYDDAVKGINALPQNMPLVDQTTYYAVIIGANGCASDPTAIEVMVKLGMNDFDLSKLKYYPNPVNDMLTVRYSEVITKVEVFDLNGRLVMTRNFDKPEVQLDFSALSAGSYMLNIKTKDNSQFVKIVKK